MPAQCAVDGCDRGSRKRGWCPSHYNQWRRTGEQPRPLRHTWQAERCCVACGAVDWQGPGRKYCSARCAQVWRRGGGNVVRSVQCSRCGCDVDTAPKPGRRKRRADTQLCRQCSKAKHLRHKASVAELSARDGAICHLCDGPIDMGLTFPDRLSATVDHVTPRATGGSDELSNLALAHYTCNSRKSARAGWRADSPAV